MTRMQTDSSALQPCSQKTGKQDRRVRKTKALLLNGLIRLMGEKDIKDISVKELADLVDINRGTFYLHYSDIYDMVNQIEDALFEEFSSILKRDLTDKKTLTSHYNILLHVFTVLNANREITQVLIGPHGDLTFVNRLKDMIKNELENTLQKEHRDPEFEYLFAFVVSGYIGVFETWLNSGASFDPQYIAELCTKLLSPGLLNFVMLSESTEQ